MEFFTKWYVAKEAYMPGVDVPVELVKMGFIVMDDLCLDFSVSGLHPALARRLFHQVRPPEGWTREKVDRYRTQFKDEDGKVRFWQFVKMEFHDLAAVFHLSRGVNSG